MQFNSIYFRIDRIRVYNYAIQTGKRLFIVYNHISAQADYIALPNKT